MPGPAQRSTALAASLAAILAVLSPGRAGAAPTPGAVRAESATSRRAALLSERARLRAELDRLNAEIDRLKRSTGVSDRLRDRLADAEGVARRLTQVDAQLGIRAEPASETKPLAEPDRRARRRTNGPRCEGRHTGRSVAAADAAGGRDRASCPRAEDPPGAASPIGGPRSRPVRRHGRLEATDGQRRERQRVGVRRPRWRGPDRLGTGRLAREER